MERIIFLLVFTLFLLSSPSFLLAQEKNVGTRHKTSSPHTPIIYKNGYGNYQVIIVPPKIKKAISEVNELRFNLVYSAFYSGKMMFDNFGKWDAKIWPKNEKHPILIWEDVSLLDDSTQLFTVATYGVENKKTIYASVIILDKNKKDCLTEDSKIKDAMVSYFSNGIKQLRPEKEFYTIYWKMIKDSER